MARIVEFFFALFALFAAAAALAVDVTNPFQTCGKTGDVLTIANISVNPYPLRKGQDFTLTLNGDLSEEITSDATVRIRVKMGFLTVMNRTENLCELLSSTGINCPLPKGTTSLTVTQNVPDAVPPGTFNIEASARTGANKNIMCVSGNVRIN